MTYDSQTYKCKDILVPQELSKFHKSTTDIITFHSSIQSCL